MATVTSKLGPADHGRPVTLDDLESAEFWPGYKYEIIDGRLYVTYEANLPEDWLEKWLLFKVGMYALKHPEVINYVTDKARVFIPSRDPVTIPEPDLAAYHGLPIHRMIDEMRWEDVSPVLVGEIVSANDPHKDLIRNAQLYLQVPSIREYWLIDGRASSERPTMVVHRRHGQRWRKIELAYGDTYTTRLLPGFELVLDPRR
jgi:Uma2 family endonuclease